jgi:hypothetical protein
MEGSARGADRGQKGEVISLLPLPTAAKALPEQHWYLARSVKRATGLSDPPVKIRIDKSGQARVKNRFCQESTIAMH